MKVAICRVRDEADIIRYTLDHILKQVDHVIISDNGSVDGTRDILSDYQSDQMTVVDDPEHSHWQGARTTELAHHAGAMGAEWVIPFDADEAWPVITPEDADVVYMRSYVFVPQSNDDVMERNPLKKILNRTLAQEPFPKVCFRYHRSVRIREGNHEVQHPGNRKVTAYGMRHYQYRSLKQVKRKVRQGTSALESTELPSSTGAHWRELAALTDTQLERWWHDYCAQPLIKTSAI